MTETTRAKGPLHGVKVLDMTSVLLGPYATQIMGDLGADIVKVEEPGKGDFIRWGGKAPNTPGMGPIYMTVNRNKRSVGLNLKEDQAREVFAELVKWADVFIHNVREGGIKRLGFDYEGAKKINPEIVYVHAVGFSSDGPYAGRQAYDDLIQAASGSASLLTAFDGNPEPRYLPTLFADKATGLHAVYATLAGLFHKERTGEGQFIEVPMLECITSFVMAEHLYGHTYDPPTGQLGYSRVINPNRKPYKTADGHLSIVPYSDDQWKIFFEMAGRPGVMDDPKFSTFNERTKNIQELYGLIHEAAASKSTSEWLKLLAEANIPAMRVNSLEQVLEDQHLKETNFFQKHEHHTEGTYVAMKHPVHFSKTPATIRRHPPNIGENTDEVLAEIGVSKAAAE